MNDITLAEVFRVVEAKHPGFLKDNKVELKEELQTSPITLVILLLQSNRPVLVKAVNLDVSTSANDHAIREKKDPNREEIGEVTVSHHFIIDISRENEGVLHREVVSL